LEAVKKSRDLILQAIQDRAGKENVLYARGATFTEVIKSNAILLRAD
jgi:hypothetical protein